MQKITYFSLLLITFSSFSQKTSWLKGRIMVDTLALEAINIVNLTQEIGTINNASGYFQIKANPGDEIVFSSVQFQLKKYVVKEEDLESNNFKVVLEAAVNELDEVRISQYSLSGDVQKDIEEIPTYEKNFPLWNAQQLKEMGVARPNDEQSPVQNLVLPSGNSMASVSVNLGFLKGKSRDVDFKTKITNIYKEEIFINELKIPETEFYNFLDFLKEETRIQSLLRRKDRLKILELLIHQSEKFREKYNIKE
ncbi:hypothetical protein [Aquimarina rubra]|uniref:Carboxypeptidase-like regulatory domain-containing protein n=1 Tax=Aquimarina rubra TaxID=1920033 RepID=A0ABW5LGI2_9FLAO